MSKTIGILGRTTFALLLAGLAFGTLVTNVRAAGPLSQDRLLPGHIVLSEIMIDPSKVSDTAGEWFELFNPFARAIDLNGLVVKSGAGSSFESFTVTGAPAFEPQSHFVFGRSANTGSNGGADVDYAWGTAISLGNTSDWLRIERADGTMLLHASWTATVSGKAYEVQSGTLPDLGQADYVTPWTGTRYGLGMPHAPGFANTHAIGVTGLVAAPVPEPESYAMMAAGLALLGLGRRRWRRS